MITEVSRTTLSKIRIDISQLVWICSVRLLVSELAQAKYVSPAFSYK